MTDSHVEVAESYTAGLGHATVDTRGMVVYHNTHQVTPRHGASHVTWGTCVLGHATVTHQSQCHVSSQSTGGCQWATSLTRRLGLVVYQNTQQHTQVTVH